jgi:hypothetical protein
MRSLPALRFWIVLRCVVCSELGSALNRANQFLTAQLCLEHAAPLLLKRYGPIHLTTTVSNSHELARCLRLQNQNGQNYARLRYDDLVLVCTAFPQWCTACLVLSTSLMLYAVPRCAMLCVQLCEHNKLPPLWTVLAEAQETAIAARAWDEFGALTAKGAKLAAQILGPSHPKAVGFAETSKGHEALLKQRYVLVCALSLSFSPLFLLQSFSWCSAHSFPYVTFGVCSESDPMKVEQALAALAPATTPQLLEMFYNVKVANTHSLDHSALQPLAFGRAAQAQLEAQAKAEAAALAAEQAAAEAQLKAQTQAAAEAQARAEAQRKAEAEAKAKHEAEAKARADAYAAQRKAEEEAAAKAKAEADAIANATVAFKRPNRMSIVSSFAPGASPAPAPAPAAAPAEASAPPAAAAQVVTPPPGAEAAAAAPISPPPPAGAAAAAAAPVSPSGPKPTAAPIIKPVLIPLNLPPMSSFKKPSAPAGSLTNLFAAPASAAPAAAAAPAPAADAAPAAAPPS